MGEEARGRWGDAGRDGANRDEGEARPDVGLKSIEHNVDFNALPCTIYALSMLYLCSIYAWAMEYLLEKYELSGRAGRVFFGKIGKMRRFRKIRKLMINASSRRVGIPGGKAPGGLSLFNIMLNLMLSHALPCTIHALSTHHLCPRPFPMLYLCSPPPIYSPSMLRL